MKAAEKSMPGLRARNLLAEAVSQREGTCNTMRFLQGLVERQREQEALQETPQKDGPQTPAGTAEQRAGTEMDPTRGSR